MKHSESEVDKMSYFGKSGPSQDGGFLNGIERGANRLHNARVTRARHAKGIGALPLISELPSDAELAEIAKEYDLQYSEYEEMLMAQGEGRATQEAVDQEKADYVKQRDAILDWAKAGPYVHEGKALAINAGTVALAVAGVYLFTRWRIPILRPARPRQSPMYAIWS